MIIIQDGQSSGVSVATVSRDLNNHPSVSEKTRKGTEDNRPVKLPAQSIRKKFKKIRDQDDSIASEYSQPLLFQNS